jgi:hypothetical protein
MALALSRIAAIWIGQKLSNRQVFDFCELTTMIALHMHWQKVDDR